ncbi:hypothetical protein ACMD2_14902 [Ananas comosus]|uniref:Uncharacterized protein n=1 Tax=Ananas comosus TaxID=4615 RepID=A0A199VYX8_ANACO|nr:hypothetical protein ACMD2_14902 [Ananas comosus]
MEVEPPGPVRYLVGAAIMMIGVVIPLGYMMFRSKRAPSSSSSSFSKQTLQSWLREEEEEEGYLAFRELGGGNLFHALFTVRLTPDSGESNLYTARQNPDLRNMQNKEDLMHLPPPLQAHIHYKAALQWMAQTEKHSKGRKHPSGHAVKPLGTSPQSWPGKLPSASRPSART